MDKALIWFIALGLLLPTMHQSSLGSVIMLAGPRLHPLWHTPWLPFLFLVSCIAMGYAVVVMESTLSSRAFGRQREDEMLASLSGVVSFVLFLFVAFRLGDLLLRGTRPADVQRGLSERDVLAGDRSCSWCRRSCWPEAGARSRIGTACSGRP